MAKGTNAPAFPLPLLQRLKGWGCMINWGIRSNTLTDCSISEN